MVRRSLAYTLILAGAVACAEEAPTQLPLVDAGVIGRSDAAAGMDSGPAQDASVADAAFVWDAAVRDGGSGEGACANRPCRDRIPDDQTFLALAQPSPEGACQYDLEVPFIAAIDGSEPTYYLDASAYAEPLDFLRLALGGAYAALDVEAYFRAFEREDLRTHWVGRIRRLRGASPYEYAVDLHGSAYWGSQDLAAELRGLLARLSATFTPPLGYGPSQYGGIRAAKQLLDPGFTVHLPATCPGETCPTGNGPCVVVPAGAELCGHHQENRDIRLEHQNRIRVQLAQSAQRLTPGGALPFVSGGVFGPDALPITPGPAVARYTSVGGIDQWSIEQQLTAGAHTIDLTFSLFGQSEILMREPFLEYLSLSGAVDGASSFTDVVQLQSCTGSGWSRYFAEADLGGGDRLRITYRHQLPFAGSGPFLLTAAEVVLGGERRQVRASLDLLYAGVHHNWDNQLWVLFGAPILYQGRSVHGIWVDEPGTTCCPVDSIRTLGADLAPLDVLDGSNYRRAPSYF